MSPPAPRASLPPGWHVDRSAVVVCDVWDAHHCVTAARRVTEMAPRMNEVLGALRERGALVVHAPDGCMDFYAGTPARWRALGAPHAEVPSPVAWHTWTPDELAALPATLTDPGWCACASAEPCGAAAAPWTRQTALIDVVPDDVATDDGQEFFNVLAERGITDVLVMGVHTNVCVLSRPYGIRQLVYWDKRRCSAAT